VFSAPKSAIEPELESADESEELEGLDLAPPPKDLPPLPEPPAAVADLVAACVRFVTTKYGVPLDGTPDTLSLLDHYVRDAREDVLKDDTRLSLVQGAVGAYFGEMLRRLYHGTWFATGDHDAWRLDFTTAYLSFNPIGMAREALLLESADGWHAHLELDAEDREELERRLTQLGPVDEDEYYAPTTRFEVVSIALDVARNNMIARGLGDVLFGPEDYKRH
jgi:hypothetical protein